MYYWVYNIHRCNNNKTKKREKGMQLFRNEVSIFHWNYLKYKSLGLLNQNFRGWPELSRSVLCLCVNSKAPLPLIKCSSMPGSMA